MKTFFVDGSGYTGTNMEMKHVFVIGSDCMGTDTETKRIFVNESGVRIQIRGRNTFVVNVVVVRMHTQK